MQNQNIVVNIIYPRFIQQIKTCPSRCIFLQVYRFYLKMSSIKDVRTSLTACPLAVHMAKLLQFSQRYLIL